MKMQEIMLILKNDGWYLVEEDGSCRQYKHPHKTGRITISGNLNYDMALEPANSILLQAGLKGISK
jgi:predicted RNA binding protein YcfA (HicA-like mRNA interferase family)